MFPDLHALLTHSSDEVFARVVARIGAAYGVALDAVEIRKAARALNDGEYENNRPVWSFEEVVFAELRSRDALPSPRAGETAAELFPKILEETKAALTEALGGPLEVAPIQDDERLDRLVSRHRRVRTYKALSEAVGGDHEFFSMGRAGCLSTALFSFAALFAGVAHGASGWEKTAYGITFFVLAAVLAIKVRGCCFVRSRLATVADFARDRAALRENKWLRYHFTMRLYPLLLSALRAENNDTGSGEILSP